MDSPNALLKAACTDENESRRLSKITKATRILTDILPFPEKQASLLEEVELFQNLFLLHIFVKNTIDMMLEMIFQVFHKNSIFLNNMWNSLLFVLCIEEEKFEDEDDGLKKAVEKETFLASLGMTPISFSCKNFNKLIKENIVKIKFFALKFVKITLDLIVESEVSRNDVEGRFHLFLNTLATTLNSELIVKVCVTLEELKEKYMYCLQDVSKFDYQVESILLAKNDGFSFKKKKKSKILLGGKRASALPNELEFQFDISKDSPDRSLTHELSLDDIEEEGPLENKAIEEVNKKALLREFETWLLDNETVISRNENIATAFKLNENLILFMSLFIQPYCININPAWVKKFPQIEKHSPPFDYQCFKLSDNGENQIYDVSRKFRNHYYFRAYRAASVLCEKKNLHYLMTVNDSAFDTIFGEIQNAVEKEETKQVNLYHIAIIVRAFLSMDSNMTADNFLSQNILAGLLENIHNPMIFDIMLGIFDPSYSQYKISVGLQKKIWRYCFHTYMFTDLTAIIIPEKEKVVGLEERRRCNKSKHLSSDFFVAIDSRASMFEKNKHMKFQLPKFSAAEGTLDYLLGPIDTKIETILRKHKEMKEYLWIEELNGEKNDIDYLRGNLRRKKKHNMDHMSHRRSTLNADISIKKFQQNLNNKVDSLGKIKINEDNSYKDDDSVTSSDEESKFDLKLKRKSLMLLNNSNDTSEKPMRKEELKNLLKSRDKKGNEKVSSFMQSEKGKGALSKLRMMLALKQAKGTDLMSPLLQKNSDRKDEFTSYRREKQAYTSSELKGLYPSTFYRERVTDLDKLSMDKKFNSENIIQTEKLALPCSELIYRIIKNSLDMNDTKGIQELVRLKPKDNTLFLDLFFDFECIHFERIFKNYMIKVRALTKLRELNNSAYFCGLTVNLILRNVDNLIIGPYHDELQKIAEAHFLYLCKTIISMHNLSRRNIKRKNHEIINPIGSTRLMIAQTFWLIIRNSKDKDYKILKYVNETVWHILFIWFYSNKTNTMFLQTFTNILKLVFTFAEEYVILTIFFKLNLLSSMGNACEEIYRNNVLIKLWDVENFFHFFRVIIGFMENCNQKRKELSTFKSQIALNPHWKRLKPLAKAEYNPEIATMRSQSIYEESSVKRRLMNYEKADSLDFSGKENSAVKFHVLPRLQNSSSSSSESFGKQLEKNANHAPDSRLPSLVKSLDKSQHSGLSGSTMSDTVLEIKSNYKGSGFKQVLKKFPTTGGH